MKWKQWKKEKGVVQKLTTLHPKEENTSLLEKTKLVKQRKVNNRKSEVTKISEYEPHVVVKEEEKGKDDSYMCDSDLNFLGYISSQVI